MRSFPCRDGDAATERRDIRSLLGGGVAFVRGLRLLRADGEAEPARGEDAGFLDLFVVFRMRIVLCRDSREIPSCGDVYIAVCRDIRRRKGNVAVCRDADILPRDFARDRGICLRIRADGGRCRGEKTARLVPDAVVVFRRLPSFCEGDVVSCGEGSRAALAFDGRGLLP